MKVYEPEKQGIICYKNTCNRDLHFNLLNVWTNTTGGYFRSDISSFVEIVLTPTVDLWYSVGEYHHKETVE